MRAALHVVMFVEAAEGAVDRDALGVSGVLTEDPGAQV